MYCKDYPIVQMFGVFYLTLSFDVEEIYWALYILAVAAGQLLGSVYTSYNNRTIIGSLVTGKHHAVA